MDTVFILMGAGLKQVNLLQKEFKDQQKKSRRIII